MSGNSSDPNSVAEQLAKLSAKMAQEAQEHATALRGSAPPPSDNETSGDPNALALKLAKAMPTPAPANEEESGDEVLSAEGVPEESKEEVEQSQKDMKKQTKALEKAVETVEHPTAPKQDEKPKEEVKPAPEKPKEEVKQPAPEKPREETKPSAPEKPKEEAKPSAPSPEKPKEEAKPSAPEKQKEEVKQPVPEKPKEEVKQQQPEVKEKEKTPPASLVKLENGDKPQIIVKGAKFGSGSPTKEDVRTHDVIVAKHVDKKRDEKAGVAISMYNLNYMFAEPDERDHKFSTIFGDIDPNYLPATTDLRPNWVEILDQLDLGACVSNSVAYCVRYTYKKQNMGDFPPSRLFIYYNGRSLAGYPINEDSGLTIRDGYKSVAANSVCSEEKWPYTVSKFAIRPTDACYAAAQEHDTFRYINLDVDAVQIKKSLKDGFPVSFGAALFESFMSADTAQSGNVPVPDQNKERRVGGHAMTICGHDDNRKAFLVVNNWGTGWGLGGFCWFPYEYMLNNDLVGDLWSIRQWN